MNVYFHGIALLISLIFACNSGYADETPVTDEKVTTSKIFSLTETYNLTNTLPRKLIDLRKEINSLADTDRIFAKIQNLRSRVEGLEWETTTATSNPNLNSHELLYLETKLAKIDTRIVKLNKRIKSNIHALELLSNEWIVNETQLQQFLAQTAEQANFTDALPPVDALDQIIRKAKQLIENKIRPTLLAGKEVGEIQARVYTLNDTVSDLLQDLNDVGFQQTAPSMFSIGFYSRFDNDILEQIVEDLLLFGSYQVGYLANNIIGVVTFLAMILLVAFLTRMSRVLVKASFRWYQFTDNPVATGVFIVSTSFVFFEALYADIALPPNWQILLQIPMIIAALFLARSVLITSLLHRTITSILIFSLTGIMFLNAINFPQPIVHLCVFGSSLFCLAYSLGNFFKRKKTPLQGSLIVRRFFLGIFLLTVCLAGIGGYEQVAVLIFDRVMSLIAITLIVWLMQKILSALLELLLVRIPVTIIRKNADSIVRDIKPVLTLAHAVFWFLLTLSYLTIFPTIGDALTALASLQFSVSSQTITPKSILVVVFAIYLTFLCSRGMNAFLTQELLPRYGVSRGVQASITRLVHYGIFVIGLMVLLNLLGFKFGDIAIIGGALGVGIGFGLKEIVNNFVSGLILLFERPVKVGDIIVVGQDMGEVTALGLRATTVQTFDNAEIVIPNAELITCSVTNWTLAEKRVRVKVPVGVAYGTDISDILKILLSCADLNPTVLTQPPPSALFLMFGDSSLNFELRVWISDFNDRMRVLSELNQDIENEFQMADIEIPFPQRDLHLKSVDADSIRAFQQATTNMSAV